MLVFEDKREMWAWSREQRAAGRSIGFVPTMGSLHRGHLGLVTLAQQPAVTRQAASQIRLVVEAMLELIRLAVEAMLELIRSVAEASPAAQWMIPSAEVIPSAADR